MRDGRMYVLFFAGLFLFLFSLSPGAIFGMGYAIENANAANQIISILSDWIHGRQISTSVSWPRHGLLELIFQIPFLIVNRVVFQGSELWSDRLLSIEPVLFTALLCTLLLVWVRRITGSLLWGFFLSTATAFSTIVWPYAYIGLETTQSLFLLLAAFLAFDSTEPRTFPRNILFALACGFAISVKASGVLLAPAVAYLVFRYLQLRNSIAGKGTVLAVILCVYAASNYTRSLNETFAQGTYVYYSTEAMAEGWISIAFNAFSLFFSVNKGLLIYCPILVACLISIPRAYTSNPGLVIFSLLTLAGLAGGISLVIFFADETWGPRYLHSAIPPLILCLAAAKGRSRFRWRRNIPLIALTAIGVLVSALGVLFYYGSVHFAATEAGQNTLESFQSDRNWNHIQFHTRLLKTWLSKDQKTAPWTPSRLWWFERPKNEGPAKTIDLKKYAIPQPWILRSEVPRQGRELFLWYLLWMMLISGAFLLWATAYFANKQEYAPESAGNRSMPTKKSVRDAIRST